MPAIPPPSSDPGPPAALERVDLPRRVRDLRAQHGWTIDELATRSDLSRASISKIENGRMSPTFDVLQRLARGFEMDLAAFFSTPSAGSGARRAVTRRGEGPPYDTPTYAHSLLAAELTRKRMQPFYSRIRARSLDEFEDWVRHEGESLLFVLEGRVRLLTEVYEPAELGPHDSIYFDTAMGHACVSIGKEDALVLWITAG